MGGHRTGGAAGVDGHRRRRASRLDRADTSAQGPALGRGTQHQRHHRARGGRPQAARDAGRRRHLGQAQGERLDGHGRARQRFRARCRGGREARLQAGRLLRHLRAPALRARGRQGRCGQRAPLARRHGQAYRGGVLHPARRRPRDQPGRQAAVRGARAVRPQRHRPRPPGQARPGRGPRGGDSPHDPGPLAPHQEQPRAHRRAGRRQDRHRGGPRPASRATCRPPSATRTSSSST